MKIIAYVSFVLAACVFALSFLSGALSIVEVFVLVALGFISLAIGELKEGQRAIEQNQKKISIALSEIDRKVPATAYGSSGLAVVKRDFPKNDAEVAEMLSSDSEL